MNFCYIHFFLLFFSEKLMSDDSSCWLLFCANPILCISVVLSSSLWRCNKSYFFLIITKRALFIGGRLLKLFTEKLTSKDVVTPRRRRRGSGRLDGEQL